MKKVITFGMAVTFIGSWCVLSSGNRSLGALPGQSHLAVMIP